MLTVLPNTLGCQLALGMERLVHVSLSFCNVYILFICQLLISDHNPLFYKILPFTDLLHKLTYILSISLTCSPGFNLPIFTILHMSFPSIFMIIYSMAFKVNVLVSGHSVDLNLIFNLSLRYYFYSAAPCFLTF